MKEIDPELAGKLSEISSLFCDWYTLRLRDGRIFRMVDTDHDIYDGNDIWYHNSALLKREQVKIQSEVTVDTMTVTVGTGLYDYIGTDHVIKAAHNGVFDRGILTFGRAWFKDEYMQEVLGFLVLFSGRTEIKKAGGIGLELTVKADTQGLNMEFPIRRYYPQSSYIANGATVIEGDGSEGIGVVAPYVPRKEVLM